MLWKLEYHTSLRLPIKLNCASGDAGLSFKVCHNTCVSIFVRQAVDLNAGRKRNSLDFNHSSTEWDAGYESS